MIQKYGKIGKSVLKRLLGLQQDGFIYQIHNVDPEIDLEKSGCLACPYYLLSKNTSNSNTKTFCSENCQRCSQKIYLPDKSTETKRYIYEKSKYGYSKPMYLNSIKVFLYIHLFGYDSNSFVKDLDIREMADYFGLHIKTVRRALNKLCDFDYLYASSPSEPLVTLFLPEAGSYAQVGGSGYFELTKDLLDQLVSVKNINSLRIILRTLLEFDESFSKGQDADILKKRITDIHKYLPQYAKPHIIKDCVKQSEAIFETVTDKKIIQFHIRDQFKTKYQHKIDLLTAQNSIEQFISEFNSEVEDINANQKDIDKCVYSQYFDVPIKKNSSYPNMFITYEDCKKIATIAVKYDSSIMQRALLRIYHHICQNGVHVDNPEAYIRTTINNLIKEYTFQLFYHSYEIE